MKLCIYLQYHTKIDMLMAPFVHEVGHALTKKYYTEFNTVIKEILVKL